MRLAFRSGLIAVAFWRAPVSSERQTKGSLHTGSTPIFGAARCGTSASMAPASKSGIAFTRATWRLYWTLKCKPIVWQASASTPPGAVRKMRCPWHSSMPGAMRVSVRMPHRPIHDRAATIFHG